MPQPQTNNVMTQHLTSPQYFLATFLLFLVNAKKKHGISKLADKKAIAMPVTALLAAAPQTGPTRPVPAIFLFWPSLEASAPPITSPKKVKTSIIPPTMGVSKLSLQLRDCVFFRGGAVTDLVFPFSRSSRSSSCKVVNMLYEGIELLEARG